MSHSIAMHIPLNSRAVSVLSSEHSPHPSPNAVLPLRIHKGLYPDFRIEPTAIHPHFVSVVASALRTLR